MKSTKDSLNPIIKKQIMGMFYQLVADAKTSKDVETLLSDLMSEQDITSLAKKIAIAIYLDKGRGYEPISEALKVSSATVASVASTLGNPGMQMAIRHVKANQWADEWSTKISAAVKRFFPMM